MRYKKENQAAIFVSHDLTYANNNSYTTVLSKEYILTR